MAMDFQATTQVFIIPSVKEGSSEWDPSKAPYCNLFYHIAKKGFQVRGFRHAKTARVSHWALRRLW